MSSIEISDDLRGWYQMYAATKAITLEQAVTYALKDWMESVGQGHIESTLGITESNSEGMTFFLASLLAQCDSMMVTTGVTITQPEKNNGEKKKSGPRTSRH